MWAYILKAKARKKAWILHRSAAPPAVESLALSLAAFSFLHFFIMIASAGMKRSLAFSFAFIMAMFMVAQLFVGPERTVQSVKDTTHKFVARHVKE